MEYILPVSKDGEIVIPDEVRRMFNIKSRVLLKVEDGEIKLENRNRLSLADSILIATAKTINAVILTTDKAVKEVTGKQTIHIEVK